MIKMMSRKGWVRAVILGRIVQNPIGGPSVEAEELVRGPVGVHMSV